MNELMRYEDICAALAEITTLPEAKDRIDKAEGIRTWAKRAKNRQTEVDAGEYRHRAERKAGELLISLRNEGRLASGRPKKEEMVNGDDHYGRVYLEDINFTKNDSAKCQKYAEYPAEKFEYLIQEWRRRSLDGKDVVPFDLIEDDRRARRAARERELGAKITALPGKKYGVIVSDPFHFEVWGNDGADRVSPADVIASQEVIKIAAEDCILGLWASPPMEAHAHDAIRAWGFTYKTGLVWIKDRIGPGYYTRSRHELFLLATKGDVPCPAPGDQVESVIEAPRRGAGEKPEAVMEMLEAYFPSLPKVQLHASYARLGWD